MSLSSSRGLIGREYDAVSVRGHVGIDVREPIVRDPNLVRSIWIHDIDLFVSVRVAYAEEDDAGRIP